MEIKVYVLSGGRLQIFVDGVGISYDQAAAATMQILDLLRAQGIAVDQTSAIEQHKDVGVEHLHIHQHQEERHA